MSRDTDVPLSHITYRFLLVNTAEICIPTFVVVHIHSAVRAMIITDFNLCIVRTEGERESKMY
jgi:hypothetical protein